MQLQKLFKKIFISVFIFSLIPISVLSATKEELQAKISQALLDKEKVEKEIAALSSSIIDTSNQKKSLTNTLNSLELTRKKLVAELNLTQKNIQVSTLTIENLTNDLNKTEDDIKKNSHALGQSIVRQSELESESLIETFLKYKSLSESWNHISSLRTFEREVQNQIDTAKDLELKLSKEKTSIEVEKKTLLSYKEQLSDKKIVVDTTSTQKNKLLADTKNKESEYKLLLAEKEAQRTAFEKQLFDFESELRIAIDPNSIPGARTGVLSWPLQNIFITQYFGRTVSAKRLYVSGTHGGIDFRSSIGTPVFASLSGVVVDTESAKTKSGCQYGKWILIRHPNGLSTIYGHLSLVSVNPGDLVVTGDRIGYSGDTGYSTGPHLHFGVYASQGIKIVDSSSLGSKYCSGIKTIAADPKAYLDPMTYLPSI